MAITLTDPAAERVKDFLANRGKGIGLRLGVKTMGCSGMGYVLEFVDEVNPDDEVFEDNAVKRLDIVITEARWQAMLDDMTNLYGTFGSGAGGPGGGLTETDEAPIFVPAEGYYNGIQWYRVGVRFKGNSSLQTSWQNGILKLSFKLDFDEFEDDYPQIDNQRFYGFKKLSLKNNYDDKSMLREKVATDVFRNAGLVASHTAFYTVYVDHGDGPTYFGLYTMVEEVDDTLIDTQFSSDDGNLYKPDGDAASFAAGTYDEYVKKNNEDEADFYDVSQKFAVCAPNYCGAGFGRLGRSCISSGWFYLSSLLAS